MARDEYSYLDHMVPVSAREVIFQSPQAIRYNTHENQPQATLDGADEMALANAGKRGDDRIAHINASEEKLLEAVSGNKSRNPETGLRQFYNVAGGGIGAGEREGYSGGGHTSGGNAGGSSNGRGGPRDTGGVTGATKNAAEAREAGRSLADAKHDNRSFGERIGDFFQEKLDNLVENPAKNVLGAAGGLFGGSIGSEIAGAFGSLIDAGFDALGPADGPGKGATGGIASGQGGGAGDQMGTPKPKSPFKPKGAAANGNPPASGNGTGQTPTTPNPNPTSPLDPQTQSLVEILLGRFETPLFSKTLSPYDIDNAKHDAMKAQAMNAILNGDGLNGVA